MESPREFKLNQKEEEQLSQELGKINQKETDLITQITTSWHEKGEIEGKIEKAQEAICEFLAKRFGVDPNETMQKIKQISAMDILDSLMEELFAANTQEEARAITDRYIARNLL